MSATETATLDQIEKRLDDVTGKADVPNMKALVGEMTKALVSACGALSGITDKAELEDAFSAIYDTLYQLKSMIRVANMLGKSEVPVAPAPVTAEKRKMTLAEFYAYASEQSLKACAEDSSKRKPRMAALAAATKSFEPVIDGKAESAEIEVFMEGAVPAPAAPLAPVVEPTKPETDVAVKSDGTEPAVPPKQPEWPTDMADWVAKQGAPKNQDAARS